MENAVKKLTSEELERIVNIKKEIEIRQNKIGEIEFFKSQIILEIVKYNDYFSNFQKELFEKYGNVEIDLSTGEIKS